jgi:hypothetical protein
MQLDKILVWVAIVGMISCVSHDIDKPVICSQSGLHISLSSTKEATDCSENDGEITVIATGGLQPYRYQLDKGALQDQQTFTAIPSGIYNITVQDKNGCTSTLVNIKLLAANFKFSTSIEPDKECIDHNGSVTIDMLEGTAPFSFNMNDGPFTNNNVFTNLKAGNYNFIVKDAASCTAALNVTVTQSNTQTSWENDILPIMKTSCALNGCHDGKTRVDFRLYDNVKSKAESVKSKTEDGSMPFDGPDLPQNQIDLIACWVDEGAPEN